MTSFASPKSRARIDGEDVRGRAVRHTPACAPHHCVTPELIADNCSRQGEEEEEGEGEDGRAGRKGAKGRTGRLFSHYYGARLEREKRATGDRYRATRRARERKKGSIREDLAILYTVRERKRARAKALGKEKKKIPARPRRRR